LLEERIEREGLGYAPLPHRDDGHGIHEAQELRAPLEQQVEAGVVMRLVCRF
jgi:hypothetical protein